MPELTGLADNDLADHVERAELLRDWIALIGDDTLIGGDGMFTPILVTDVLGRASADRLRAGRLAAIHGARLLALCVGLAPQLGDDGFIESCLFDRLREIDGVLLEEGVACFVGHGVGERSTDSSDVSGSQSGISVDQRSDEADGERDPDVHDASELVSVERDLGEVVGGLAQGADLLARLRIALVRMGEGKRRDADSAAPIEQSAHFRRYGEMAAS